MDAGMAIEILSNMKRDRQVLSFLAHGVCEEEEVYQYAIKRLNLEQKSERQLISILVKMDLDNDSSFCLRCIELLRLNEKSEQEILYILSKLKRNFIVFQAALPSLSLVEKSDNEIMNILSAIAFDDQATASCLPFLKEEANVLLAIKKSAQKCSPYSEHLLQYVLSLNLSEKSEEYIMEVLKYLDYRDALCFICAPVIKKEKNIWLICSRSMYGFDYQQLLSKVAVITDSKIIKALEKAQYNHQLSFELLPFLKSEESMRLVLRSIAIYRSGYDASALASILKLAERSEDFLLFFMVNFLFIKDYCMVAMPFMKYAPTIIAVLEKNYYDDDLLQEAVPRLQLQEKSDEEIIDMIRRSKYNPSVCEAFITFLKKPVNIISVIERSGYKEAVCKSAIKSGFLKKVA